MTGEQLRALIKRSPFRPIEISLENGERYAIRHPESVAMTADFVLVRLPGEVAVFFETAVVTSIRTLARNGHRKS